jgi:3-methyladenine DNA glycosylase/8-oxoguanine DNA glycosylase
MHLTLPARPPFRFRSIIQSHGWFQLAPLRWDDEAGVLHLPLQLTSGSVIPLVISGDESGIHATSDELLSQAEAEEIATRLAWMFNLDADFDEFYALADAEPRLAHCRPNAHGRLLRSPTLYEDVVKVMATTNIQWGGTKRLVRQLVDAFGAPLPSDDGMRAFPQIEPIAASDEATLRGLSWGYRSPYLLKLTRGLLDGTYNLDTLRNPDLPTPDLRKALLDLPGIGPYAAATLLGILGRYDYIGVDTEAVSIVSKHFHNGESVGAKEIDAVFARWGKFKSLAYWFWDYAGMQQAPMEAWESSQ